MKTRHILMAMAAPAALMATPAKAAVFTFNLSGAYTASFDIDMDAFAAPDDFGDYFEVDATGTIEGRTGSHIVAFNTTAFDGGLTLGDSFTNLWGEQLFTGTTAAPTLRTGTFNLLLGGEAGRNVSIDIAAATAAVPEPASWAMMIAGFGLAGIAMRRRAPTRVACA